MRGSEPREPVGPVIGLTSYLDRARFGVWDARAGLLPAAYLEGVTAAGGIAVLLPPQPVTPQIAARVLDGICGLVITGGRDLDPAGYGQPPHAETDQPDATRDAWEFALLAEALRRRLPVLGICRGAQVLNVALGGTLHQHLPDVLGSGGHRAATACSPRCRRAPWRAPDWPTCWARPARCSATTTRRSPSWGQAGGQCAR